MMSLQTHLGVILVGLFTHTCHSSDILVSQGVGGLICTVMHTPNCNLKDMFAQRVCFWIYYQTGFMCLRFACANLTVDTHRSSNRIYFFEWCDYVCCQTTRCVIRIRTSRSPSELQTLNQTLIITIVCVCVREDGDLILLLNTM